MLTASTEYYTNEPSNKFPSLIKSCNRKIESTLAGDSTLFPHYLGRNSNRKEKVSLDKVCTGKKSCSPIQNDFWKLLFETESSLFALENHILGVYASKLSYSNNQLEKVLKTSELEKLEKELESLRSEVSDIKVHSDMAPLLSQMNSLKKTVENVPVALSVLKWINVVDKALENFCALQNSVNLVSRGSRSMFSGAVAVSHLLDELDDIQGNIVVELESLVCDVRKLGCIRNVLNQERLLVTYHSS